MERENKPYSKLYVDIVGLITPTSFFRVRYMQLVTEDSLRIRHLKTLDLKAGLDKQLVYLIELA